MMFVFKNEWFSVRKNIKLFDDIGIPKNAVKLL